MKKVEWRYSTEKAGWQVGDRWELTDRPPDLWLDGREYQKMHGFGACFNELGYQALLCLDKEQQETLLQQLFQPSAEGCNFNFCRLPIGANDYAKDWYSLDETAGDYELRHFSVARDEQGLIPYVKRAQQYAPQLGLFASPWSPPAWMKDPPVYNWGKLVWDERTLTAYANYFVKYVKSYAQRGIRINQVHVQNEPVANQKFPSCMWTGAELRDFIRDYLGPAFEWAGLDTEIWLGTINAPGCDYRRLIFDKWATEDYDYFANIALQDDAARRYIAGVSYQWGGKIAIQRTFESWWPEIRLMQSENECGFGDNTWEYAKYVWTMLKHYIGNGAESYLYWNMILKPEGRSTWGDPQNAMVTVDPVAKAVVYNPDFYVMKHFSNPIRQNAVRLGAAGRFAADSLIFKNPDGATVLELFNPFKTEKPLTVELDGQRFSFVLPGESFNSVVFQKE